MKILNYNLNNYQALLFDLDGTVVNSVPIHDRAWIETFHEYGIVIDLQFLKETTGMASTRIVKVVNEKFGVDLDPKTLSDKKRARYLENVEDVKLVGPVFEILKAFHGKLPMGAITGGSHQVVDFLLPKLGIAKYFQTVVCSDDTRNGKDSTEPYELACGNLKVEMNKCIFFDDGDIGLTGAKLSGMDIIQVDIDRSDIFLHATI